MSKPTVISTFAGTGGSSLGYHLAGFKELLAIDFESHAVESFKLNFPDVPVWQRDVKTVTAEEILSFCNIKQGELDVFDGSPPCQGFSTAGKRELSDDRNDLFKDYCRLVDGLKPKIFVMENVAGMVSGTFKGKFVEIISHLKTFGYNVKCKKLNAANYEVPQARERLFFIGVRNDLNKEPVFPIPKGEIISVGKALKTVKEPGYYPPIINQFILENINKVKPGEKFSKYHPKKNYFGYSRLPLNKPCGTIIKTHTVMLHPLENRNIGINEAKILCSFPEDWNLDGDFKHQWGRLGNAVMPNQMKHIALALKRDVLNVEN